MESCIWTGNIYSRIRPQHDTHVNSRPNTHVQIFKAFSDYRLVTQALDIKPTEQQREVWQLQNELRELDGLKPRKTWKPPQKLGEFHEDYAGHKIPNYHSVLPDANALHTVENTCVALKQKHDQWRQTKHLAKPVSEIVERVAKNASSYGAKHGHTYSRPPYGQRRPNCHHNYPCSVYASKKQPKTVTFKCNGAFNERKKDKDTGEYSGQDRRCSFRMCGTDWEQERDMAENVQIAMEIEANEHAVAIGSVRL